MDDLIQRLAGIPNARVDTGPSSWTIRFAKPGALEVEVIVPHSVLEWFVTVRDASGAELWSDWMDYAGYVARTEEQPEQMASAMAGDIECFVTTLAAADDFRVTSNRILGVLPRRTAEWRISGQWQAVALART